MQLRTIALAALFLLGGCKTTEIARPPEDKLVCPDEPGAPAGAGTSAGVTDEAAGEYLKKLRGAWQGCKADVDWLRDWYAALPKSL